MIARLRRWNRRRKMTPTARHIEDGLDAYGRWSESGDDQEYYRWLANAPAIEVPSAEGR